MTTKLTAALVAALAVGATVTTASAAVPVVPEDLFKMTLLSRALISPDGSHVLVESSKMNGPNDSYDRGIILIDVASGRMLANVTKNAGDRDYDWMPDSASFVFVRRAESQTPQLYRYTLKTGAIVKLTSIKQGVSAPVVSHDGKHIALTVTDVDEPEAAHVDFAKAGFIPKDSQKKTDIHTVDQLFWQANGQGYVYQYHPHIWIIDADGSRPRQLTSGKWAEGFDAWSPDDHTIAFNSTRYDSVDWGNNDVYFVPTTGGDPQKLVSAKAANSGLFFSSDGSRFYFLSAGITDAAELASVVSAKPDGSDARVLVPINIISWGDSLLADMKEGGGLCASALPNGKQALVNVDGPGYANLRTLDLQNGALADVTPPKGEAWSCTVSRDGKSVAYLYSDFTHPADVYVGDVATGAKRQLTHVNQAYLTSVMLSIPQELSVKDPAGFTVQAWFMPATAGTGPKHATLLSIHGGPEAQFGESFFQEFQYYTSLGYNVVFSDPAGSSGHGYGFEEAIENNYGDAMFQDTQAVMDTAAQRPDVDSSRLGVLGGSYGGYATLWLISHTNRYKAAVAERAVSNLLSENLGADVASKNSLVGGYYAWGPAWDPNSTLYAKFSPLTYVGNVHTPVLILHTDLDTRTPVDQSIVEFTALKVLGQTVEYVAVPNENHDLPRTGSPIHRVERLHIIADWMGKYLKP